MADATVTYEVKGTSDVQEQTDKAKKSMSQMENAIEGLNKKMSTWGKDLILSYIAPMVLLNKAIDYIAASIEKQRQLVKDSLEFTRKGESKEIDPAFQRQAQIKFDREKAADDKEKATLGRAALTEDFLKNASDKDMDRLFKRLGPGSEFMYKIGLATPEQYSKDSSIQNAVRDIRNADIMREEEARVKARGTGIDNLSVQNPVFGVGTVSPVVTALDKQIEEQQKQTVLLERIANSTPQPAEQKDYTKMPNRATPYGL